MGLLGVWTPHVLAQDGVVVFKQVCASCHEPATNRAPERQTLRTMTPEAVLAALETGAMLSVAVNLTAVERRAVAEYVTEKAFAQRLELTPAAQAMCPATSRSTFNPRGGSQWNGWGVNTSNCGRVGRAPE